MVSVVSSLNVLVSPVKVLTEICICGRRRRTSSIRLHWGVDSLEDKALLVSLEGDNRSRAGFVEDLHLWSSSNVGFSAQVESGFSAKIRRCWSVWIPFVARGLVLTLSIVSIGSTSKAKVFPAMFFTKICIRGRRRASVFRLQMGSGFLRR